MPDEELLACGIAPCFEDPEAPENTLRVDKLDVAEFTTFLGCDD